MLEMHSTLDRIGLTLAGAAIASMLLTSAARARQECPLYPCPTVVLNATSLSTGTGDLNGDSAVDVVVGRANSSVDVWMNDGHGRFSMTTNLATAAQSRAIVVSDIDGDGDNDVITTNRDSSTMSVLVNTGSGQFNPAVNSPCGVQPTALALGDLDNDGDLDAAAINSQSSGTLTTLRNIGAGSFTVLQSVQVGNLLDSVDIGKLNNDAFNDVVITYRVGSAGRLAILYNNGNATLGQPIVALETADALPSAKIGDLDQDGDRDIVSVRQGLVSIRLINDGFGGFKPAGTTFGPGGSNATAFADINADQLPDLLSVQPSGSRRPLVRSMAIPGATFAPPVLVYGADDPHSLGVGDVDSDGNVDAIAGQPGRFIMYRNTGAGAMAGETAIDVGLGFEAMMNADLDGDGKQDLIGAGGGAQFATMRNLGDAVFAGPVPYTFGSGAAHRSMAFGDINADGRDDVVFLASNLRTYVLYRSAAGPFSPIVEFPFGSGAGHVACADLDHDSDVDIVMTNPETSNSGTTMSIIKNNGAGVLGPPTFVTTGTTPFRVLTGDMDGDDNIDVVVANLGFFGGTAAVSVFPNNGNGVFSASTVSPLDGRPGDAALDDLDGDGDLDVVAALTNTLTGGLDTRVALLSNNGAGVLQPPVYLPVTVIPSRIMTRDVNADGRPDIVTIGSNLSTVCVLINGGQGPFRTLTYSVERSPTGLAIADFTGDERPDIVISHSGGPLGLLKHQGYFVNVTQQPSDAIVEDGEDVSFAVSVDSLIGLTFQWLRGDVELSDDAHISGSATPTLLISAATRADEATYRVRILRDTCELSSMPATLTVHAPCPADIEPVGSSDHAVNVLDLLAVINNWGACTSPCPPHCAADVAPVPTGDCVVDVVDLLLVINSWGPCPK